MGSPIAAMIAEYIRNHSSTAQHHIPENFSLYQDCLVKLDSAARFLCTFMLYIYWHADIIFIVTGFEIYVFKSLTFFLTYSGLLSVC